MEKFVTLTSSVAPLPLRDVDTDMIIPAQCMTSVSRKGYGENLFRRLRDSNKDFALNQPRYRSAQILVADHNFGCGSSREHAVWALTDWGFKVVIAKSFADIFSGNSAKNGLLLIALPEATVEHFQREAAERLELTVDLEKQEVHDSRGEVHLFDYDPFRKHCLLQGVDDLDYILARKAEIEAFRKRQTPFVSTTSVARS